MFGRLTEEDLNRKVCLYGDKRRGIDLSGKSPIIYFRGWFMNPSTYETLQHTIPAGWFDSMRLRDFIGLLGQSGLSLNDVINMEEGCTNYTESAAYNLMRL